MSNIEEAIVVLEEHIRSIHTVSQWAEKMGYESDRYFSRKVRNHFGFRPKKIIVEKKLEQIKLCLSNSPEAIYFCLALKLGFVDDNALYKFIKRHTGKSPGEFKKECKK